MYLRAINKKKKGKDMKILKNSNLQDCDSDFFMTLLLDF